MIKWNSFYTAILYLIFTVILISLLYFAGSSSAFLPDDLNLILNLSQYQDEGLATAGEQLRHRILVQPFNLASLTIFILAITHTLFAPHFISYAEKRKEGNILLNKEIVEDFGVEILKFLGEVEVIFGIWVIPLIITMIYYYDWATAISYLNSLQYIEALFVVVIMSIASTQPILKATEKCLHSIAKLGGGTVKAWWLTILTLGPLAGSLITEPGAMTLSALMLGTQFFRFQPSLKLAYATIGLLFVNISVGGVFTSFAAPPILMISESWKWNSLFMIKNFGWKAVIGILLSNILYFFVFKRDFLNLEINKAKIQEQEFNSLKQERDIPLWITLVNMAFLAWVVIHNHYPVIFIGAFLLFLGFQTATQVYQSKIELRMPILVGFFLAGLIVHGNLQGWWISPILEHVSDNILMGISVTLTAFTDNAQITFLASLIPTFTDAMKYAVVAGAVTGGGLTVIANAPNPLGRAILNDFFPRGVSTAGLFLAAIVPTITMGLMFWIFKPF